MANGKRYDSKAITGVAHRYQHGVLLSAAMFSGGDSTVANRLERLGFEVTRPVSLPDWTVDELMLALDLYLRTRGRVSYSSTSKEVTELSAELRALRIFTGDLRSHPRFRNPSGVALKLHNFSSIDPDHEGQGMAHGSAKDADVWDAWAHRPGELGKAVTQIRAKGKTDNAPIDTGEDEEYEAPEGRILYREHRRYERDRRLVAKKKAAALNTTGRLACEVCDFESSETYDVEGIIDVHHIVPLHKLGESVTTLRDLALVCPTCHRVLHKHRPVITPPELREMRLRS